MEKIISEERRKIVCVFVDKIFSASPETQAKETVFHRFFEDMNSFAATVEFTQPAKLFKSRELFKKVYLPPSLNNGLLLEESFATHPKQFLISRPSANNIYAKMLFTNVLIHHLRGDKERKKTAREELWKSQGYDSFSPLISGGVSSHAVRKTAYRALLEAEKITRENSVFIPSLVCFDFNADGEGEYLFQGEQLNCYINHKGASIFELDYLPRTWNFLDTFQETADDNFRRESFSDLLVPPDAAFQNFVEETLYAARHCYAERYDLVKMDKDQLKVSFRLPAKNDTPYGGIELKKEYSLKNNAVTVHYAIRNAGLVIETFLFMPAVNLSFSGENTAFLTSATSDLLSCPPHVPPADRLTLHNKKNEAFISLSSSRPFAAWVKPIYASDKYQSHCIMPATLITLAADETCNISYELEVTG
jgi:hypothetical protein